MSLCTESPRRVGSYLLVDSDRIKAHVPAFLAWCDRQHDDDQAAYVAAFQTEENRRRSRWPQWWFGGPQLNLDEARVLVGRDRQQWRDDVQADRGPLSHRWYIPHDDYRWDRERYARNQTVAHRLLDMAEVEPRVFVSADDFDAVFRTGFGNGEG